MTYPKIDGMLKETTRNIIFQRGRGTIMYQKMYTVLFNAVTDSLGFLREKDISAAQWRLEEAQRETEAIFINSGEESPSGEPENS